MSKQSLLSCPELDLVLHMHQTPGLVPTLGGGAISGQVAFTHGRAYQVAADALSRYDFLPNRTPRGVRFKQRHAALRRSEISRGCARAHLNLEHAEDADWPRLHPAEWSERIVRAGIQPCRGMAGIVMTLLNKSSRPRGWQAGTDGPVQKQT